MATLKELQETLRDLKKYYGDYDKAIDRAKIGNKKGKEAADRAVENNRTVIELFAKRNKTLKEIAASNDEGRDDEFEFEYKHFATDVKASIEKLEMLVKEAEEKEAKEVEENEDGKG